MLCVDLHLAKEAELEVAAGSLSLSFEDCGAQHAVTKDVRPTSLALGQDIAMTAISLAEDLTASPEFGCHCVSVQMIQFNLIFKAAKTG